MADPINVYLVAGGKYHDIDFARLELLKLLAEHERIRVLIGPDYADSEAIAAADVLVTYTCDVQPQGTQINAIKTFLGAGRRWLRCTAPIRFWNFLKTASSIHRKMHLNIWTYSAANSWRTRQSADFK